MGKGASNRFGNTNGSNGRGRPTKHINYPWGKDFNKNTLERHFKDHGKEFNCDTLEDYVAKAIEFANRVDKNNITSFVDENGSTYKYEEKTNTLEIIDKNGYIITFFKPKNGKKYYIRKKKGDK